MYANEMKREKAGQKNQQGKEEKKPTEEQLNAAILLAVGVAEDLDGMSYDAERGMRQTLQTIDEEYLNANSSVERAALDEYRDEIVRAERKVNESISAAMKYANDLRTDFAQQLESNAKSRRY